MEAFVQVLGAFSLIGVVCTGVGCAAIGGAMGTCLVAGLVDGPTGGRLAGAQAGAMRYPSRVGSAVEERGGEAQRAAA